MSQGQQKTYRRRKFLINPQLQLTVIAFNLVLAVIAIIIFYVENLYLFNQFVQANNAEMIADPIIAELIQEEARRMNIAFFLVAGCVVTGMITGGLILSNRIAGPIYRLDQHMKKMLKEGKKSNVKFRDKDYFHEVADTFNQLMDRVDLSSESDGDSANKSA